MSTSISLTESAIESARALRATHPEYTDKFLRLYLAGKGCDGFDYGVSFDDAEPGDTTFEVAQDLKLICDARTLEFVVGSTIEWVDDERGRGFLVNNPNHRKFRGKFYKKEAWRKKLEELQSPSS
jgi:iron-sulfur cluster assembly accessory protein